MPDIALHGVDVDYGQLRAVRGATIAVEHGELLLVLGANGAGKSSLLRAIAGDVKTSSGSIHLLGRDVTRLSPYARARIGVGYAPEGRGVFPRLSVEENIAVGARTRRAREEAYGEAFELFPSLAERRKQQAGLLSGGEQQMLSMARCLAGRPSMLLLDEVSLGLAPVIVEDLFSAIRLLREAGRTIVLVEQFAHAALQFADRAAVMVSGRITKVEPAAAFAALTSDEFAREYFGITEQHHAAKPGSAVEER